MYIRNTTKTDFFLTLSYVIILHYNQTLVLKPKLSNFLTQILCYCHCLFYSSLKWNKNWNLSYFSKNNFKIFQLFAQRILFSHTNIFYTYKFAFNLLIGQKYYFIIQTMIVVSNRLMKRKNISEVQKYKILNGYFSLDTCKMLYFFKTMNLLSNFV